MSENTQQRERHSIARAILEQLAIDVGTLWTNELTQADRDLFRAVSEDAAAVLLLGLAGDRERALRERAHVEAQLCNLTSAAAARAARAFWSSLERVLNRAVQIAVAAAL